MGSTLPQNGGKSLGFAIVTYVIQFFGSFLFPDLIQLLLVLGLSSYLFLLFSMI